MDYNTIINTLRNNIVTVKFTKANGDERTMRATLIAELTPEVKGTGKPNTDENLVKCYDVEAEGWRSFKVDTVKEFYV